MNREEYIEQLEGLLEAWNLNEADLNQTDINAIRYMLKDNKNLKQELIDEGKLRSKYAFKYMEAQDKLHFLMNDNISKRELKRQYLILEQCYKDKCKRLRDVAKLIDENRKGNKLYLEAEEMNELWNILKMVL